MLAAATTVEDLVVLKRRRTLAPHTTGADAAAEADNAPASADADAEVEEKSADFAFTTAAVAAAEIPLAKWSRSEVLRGLIM
ncbi:hypothetical protein [Streptomyces sp. NBC_01618]|uniref:hypothetical protein n=1 Tax=Streptomyces sp. NBC_01618 TaxID=2975900 RepID=UPI00386DBA40|nr:hypothetical protein OH735_00410 [Streptomyces sp. NBC_01618]WTE38303.1 hypothetical protein OH735_38020 [Streptomyces sp. NBC_01618]